MLLKLLNDVLLNGRSVIKEGDPSGAKYAPSGRLE